MHLQLVKSKTFFALVGFIGLYLTGAVVSAVLLPELRWNLLAEASGVVFTLGGIGLLGQAVQTARARVVSLEEFGSVVAALYRFGVDAWIAFPSTKAVPSTPDEDDEKAATTAEQFLLSLAEIFEDRAWTTSHDAQIGVIGIEGVLDKHRRLGATLERWLTTHGGDSSGADEKLRVSVEDVSKHLDELQRALQAELRRTQEAIIYGRKRKRFRPRQVPPRLCDAFTEFAHSALSTIAVYRELCEEVRVKSEVVPVIQWRYG